MAIHFIIFLALLVIILLPLPSSSTTYTTLNQGSSLSSPADVLVSSPKRIFTAGFHPVGDNAYCFAIWFTQPLADGTSTVVWAANRDHPVNGRNTKLYLSNSGNLQLEDAGHLHVWATGTKSHHSTLQLQDSGDLVLLDTENSTIIWRSFDSPTDTLLPQQPLTKNTKLISSRSFTNYSSGFYTFYFDNDNVLRLLYAGVEITSVFWPPTWLNSWSAGRSTYNTSRTAMLDLYGNFSSSDNFNFSTWDFGIGPQRRLTLDADGLARVYSLNKNTNMWEVSWQLHLLACSVHGICGANSLCRYSHEHGRSCACLPGYKIKNHRDWSDGCLPDFDQNKCQNNSDGFSVINQSEFYGYDLGYFHNKTLEECESHCLSYCDCRGFQLRFEQETGVPVCFLKNLLFNGYQSSEYKDWVYLRLPKHLLLASNEAKPVEFNLNCTSSIMEVERIYPRENEHAWLKSLVWCVGAIGAVEVMCLLIFLYKAHGVSNNLLEQRYFQVITGFKRFTYAELKKASHNFSEEIGRGGSGVVYKGVLSDNRVAAIKRLNEARFGEEAEFLAEVSLIGRLNHANLIERWGYCAEGKHRILVYEYLGNGSLAENLRSNKLDWRKRFEIAVGTAKGLAYLHQECLEWVLHCDVKPHNILLDANYKPKVADFGLSKQVKRSSVDYLNVSNIRGTRGYMAPEWVYNLPITAKVDVYSYGVVVLEMVTGKDPAEMNFDGGMLGNKRVESLEEGSSSSVWSWIQQNLDPKLRGDLEYEADRLVNLVRVALLCAQENRDARPSMTQVVDMLLR
ncbi:hypothetical protein C2S52_013893 [Perilla frutescens var. hirtella]|nr:hypothetical protein C2S51_016142 [Perilla frutescens var. frutescens]KAH6776332.1 hypothetical protein C2S52_013893 [Perilla frutescens var. hirtella]